MTRADLLAAVEVLPRYDHRHTGWTINGTRTFVRGKRMNVRERRMVDRVAFNTNGYGKRKRISNWIKGSLLETAKVEWVKLDIKTLRLTHGNLRPEALLWLAKQDFRFNHWRFRRLPVFVRLRGRMFLLNGHHRCALCRLARRRLRARVIEL